MEIFKAFLYFLFNRLMQISGQITQMTHTCVCITLFASRWTKNESRYACIIISYLLKHVCVFSISRAACVDESGNSTRQSVAMAGHPGAWLPAKKSQNKNGERQSAKIQIILLLFQPRKWEDKDRKLCTAKYLFSKTVPEKYCLRHFFFFFKKKPPKLLWGNRVRLARSSPVHPILFMIYF